MGNEVAENTFYGYQAHLRIIASLLARRRATYSKHSRSDIVACHGSRVQKQVLAATALPNGRLWRDLYSYDSFLTLRRVIALVFLVIVVVR